MKKWLIIGEGKTGLSVKNWCNNKGISCDFWTDNNQSDDVLLKALNNVDALVISPSVPKTHPLYVLAENKKIPIYTDFDLFYQERIDVKCIGITGTNGKSTTTALVTHILKKYQPGVHMGGNIGIPILDMEIGNATCFVLELSSYQLDHIKKFNYFSSVLLNITPDHLERHKTIENYSDAKERIFENCENPVISLDDDFTKAIYEKLKNNPNTLTISSKHKADFWLKDDVFIMHHETMIMKSDHLFLKGAHNIQNILAAIALCYNMKIPFKAIIDGLQSFKGLSHRLEYIKSINDITFVNDSKATNVEAAKHGLLAYKDFDIYLILGGVLKSEDISAFSSELSFVKKAYLIGDSVSFFSKELLRLNVNYDLSNTLETAVHRAYQDALKSRSFEGKPRVVLLSPACASFDQFKNFEDRGDVYKKIVSEIEGVV